MGTICVIRFTSTCYRPTVDLFRTRYGVLFKLSTNQAFLSMEFRKRR